MCPPSAIFPHNHTSLFAEVEFAANLRDVGADWPIIGHGSCRFCLKRFLLCTITILSYFCTCDQQKEALARTLSRRFCIDPIFTAVPQHSHAEPYLTSDYSYVIIYILIVDFLDFSSLSRRFFVQIITEQPFTVQSIRTYITYVHFVLG